MYASVPLFDHLDLSYVNNDTFKHFAGWQGDRTETIQYTNSDKNKIRFHLLDKIYNFTRF